MVRSTALLGGNPGFSVVKKIVNSFTIGMSLRFGNLFSTSLTWHKIIGCRGQGLAKGVPYERCNALWRKG